MKATITRPDGTRIEVEGGADEILRLAPVPLHAGISIAGLPVAPYVTRFGSATTAAAGLWPTRSASTAGVYLCPVHDPSGIHICASSTSGTICAGSAGAGAVLFDIPVSSTCSA